MTAKKKDVIIASTKFLAMWYVYIVRCKDNSLYTGITNDVQKRLQRHNTGRGAKYTRAKRPVELMYTEEFSTRSQAQVREAEIKDFSVENKKRLIKFGVGKKCPSPRVSIANEI